MASNSTGMLNTVTWNIDSLPNESKRKRSKNVLNYHLRYEVVSLETIALFLRIFPCLCNFQSITYLSLTLKKFYFISNSWIIVIPGLCVPVLKYSKCTCIECTWSTESAKLHLTSRVGRWLDTSTAQSFPKRRTRYKPPPENRPAKNFLRNKQPGSFSLYQPKWRKDVS